VAEGALLLNKFSQARINKEFLAKNPLFILSDRADWKRSTPKRSGSCGVLRSVRNRKERGLSTENCHWAKNCWC